MKKIASGWIWVLKDNSGLVGEKNIVVAFNFVRRVFEIASELTDAKLEIEILMLLLEEKKQMVYINL